jgi:outer membrane protein, multidrug efflux system
MKPMSFIIEKKFMNYHSLLFLGLAILLFISGCKPVGPDYISPSPALPDAWSQQLKLNLESGPVSNLESWWLVFNDTVLNDIISEAKNNNANLQIAFSRVLEARADYSGVKGDKLPYSDVHVGISESKMSDNGTFAQIAPSGGFNPQSLFSTGVNATWEIDVFGRVRRSIEAAGYKYQQTIDDYYDVMVILLADVAMNYLEVRANQQMILNALQNAEDQTKSLELTKVRYSSGLCSYLDVAQAQYNLAETKSSLPEFEIQEYMALGRIAVLLGKFRDSLNPELLNNHPMPVPDTMVTLGIPADLLRQRPDIRAKERAIAQANAEIGVATADLYPTFSLSGFLGFGSKSVTSLFTIPGLQWGISLPVQWEIFNRKRIRANIAIREYQAEQLLISYENTVLKAYTEVDNSIFSYNKQTSKHEFLKEAVEANTEAVSLVNTQYENGLTDFQNVLDTERSLYRAQNKLVESQSKKLIDLVSIYQSLGGGWPVSNDSVQVLLR